MAVLLLSTYDLGRQPFGLASPAAWLRRAGFAVTTVDLSRDRLAPEVVAAASLVAFYLPMHTATRLALPVIDRIRAQNPAAVVCAYGLYAPLNAALLCDHGVSVVLGPEAEADLVALAAAPLKWRPTVLAAAPLTWRPTVLAAAPLTWRPAARAGRDRNASTPGTPARSRVDLPKLSFIQPDRVGLPPLARYASLQMADGSRRVVGATDATRGCKHRCRHCPIVPVYDGQFRVVPHDLVLADIRAQVESGAQHITFGDPDFLNGPTHARRIVEALHHQFPALTYDATIKVEHLLAHRDLLPTLARTGCLFVTSAVESVDDQVLRHLEKGHTRLDFVEAAGLCRAAGLTLAPTFVAFTPWTSLDGYRDLLDVVDDLNLAAHVAPVQWGIRLLVTWQSRLLELPDIQRIIGPFDQTTLTYPWRHADSRVDALQAEVMHLVGVRLTRPREEIIEAVRGAAGASTRPARARATIPYLDEPWYC